MACQIKDCSSCLSSTRLTLLGGYQVEICTECANRWHRYVVKSEAFKKKSSLENKGTAVSAVSIGIGFPHAETVAMKLDSIQAQLREVEFSFFEAAEKFVATGSVEGTILE